MYSQIWHMAPISEMKSLTAFYPHCPNYQVWNLILPYLQTSKVAGTVLWMLTEDTRLPGLKQKISSRMA